MSARSLKRASVDEVITQTLATRDVGELERSLQHASARVVLAAARVVEEHELAACGPALVEAFVRLVEHKDPAKGDPQCRAKAALLTAMMRVEADGERLAYARGLDFVQREPVWGGSVDTAAEVRGLAALGLLRSRAPDAAVLAAKCLADPERPARTAAAHALGEAQPGEALPLLRYKLCIGDDEPEVIGAAFASFLSLAPEQGLALAPALLQQYGEPEQEAVLLALGESRRPEAFELLKDFTAHAGDETRAVAFVAMTLLRDEPATAWLVKVLAEGPQRHASQALKALAHFRHDPRLAERVREAAHARGDAQLSAEAFEALKT